MVTHKKGGPPLRVAQENTVRLYRTAIGAANRQRFPVAALTVAMTLGAFFPAAAHAVITLGPEGRNLTPPRGSYRNSGWQYQGKWGKFLGTAIGPHHFITARHVGGLVGDRFEYRGRQYETINVEKFPNCDLAVWTVAGTLPEYAPLYTGKEEIGRQIIFFGRGTLRGEPFVWSNTLRGWRWGKHDHQITWGLNYITAILPSGGAGPLQQGEKLVFDFSLDGGPDEGAVSSGDSGGGLFLQEEGTWKLAGINFGASSQYSPTGESDTEVYASLFDGRGLWQKSGNGYAWTGELATYAAASLSFATRISPYVPRIEEILRQPPRRQIFTRRRVTLAAAGLFLVALVGFILRARRRLKEWLSLSSQRRRRKKRATSQAR